MQGPEKCRFRSVGYVVAKYIADYIRTTMGHDYGFLTPKFNNVFGPSNLWGSIRLQDFRCHSKAAGVQRSSRTCC